MKKITLLALLIFNLNIKAQENIEYIRYDFNIFTKPTIISDLIAVKNHKSDTLFLINNEMGKYIELIWEMDKNYKNKPIIVYLTLNELNKKEKCYKNVNN